MTLLVAQPAAAATFMFLDSQDGDWLGGGRAFYLAAPATPFIASQRDTVVGFKVDSSRWNVRFYVPLVARIEAGTYENAVEFGSPLVLRPRLEVNGNGHACSRVNGRFVVHEAAYDAEGILQRFSVDFEQYCDGSGVPLEGSLRYAVGDDTCATAADGTDCDDEDACTDSSTCSEGRCLGGARTTCDPNVGQCREPGLCRAVDGICTHATPKQYGAPCEDDNVCNYSQCDDGECISWPQLSCYDDDACTNDFCDPVSGCYYVPIPGECGAPGVAGTLGFVRQVFSDPDALGYMQAATAHDEAAGNAYMTESNRQSVSIVFYVFDVGYVGFSFGAADGDALVPGVYEDAVSADAASRGDARPWLSVRVPGFCQDPTGRFIVYEASYGQATELIAFAADFEMTCEDGRQFAGAVRWRAGSSACLDAPDGTPCDDENACTTTSACVSGACAGDGATVCAPVSGGCIDATACDPRNGTCVAGARPDESSCAEPAECITDGRCQSGVCTTFRPPCDDLNPCTSDQCGAGTCVNGPIAGTCWAIETKTKIRIRGPGKRTCSCTTATEALLVALTDDGRVLTERGGCYGVSPDAAHAWTKGKRGRLALTFDPFGQCSAPLPEDLESVSATGWAKLSASRLRGVQTQRWTLGPTIAGKSSTRLIGRRSDGRTFPDAESDYCRAMWDCLLGGAS